MKQKKLSTNLTAAGVVVTVMAAALFFVVFPVYGRKIAVDYPEFSGISANFARRLPPACSPSIHHRRGHLGGG